MVSAIQNAGLYPRQTGDANGGSFSDPHEDIFGLVSWVQSDTKVTGEDGTEVDGKQIVFTWQERGSQSEKSHTIELTNEKAGELLGRADLSGNLAERVWQHYNGPEFS